MARSWWQFVDEPLQLGGSGSLHDVNDTEESPRLLGMRSVSVKAAWALHDRPNWKARHVGFVHPKKKRRR